VRLEEESSKAGRPNLGAEERIYVFPTDGSRRTKRRSAESNSTPGFRRGPEEVPEESPGLQRRRRPVTIKARVIEKNFSFREASASFQAERFFFVRVELSVCW
jgi:hypothetical protein